MAGAGGREDRDGGGGSGTSGTHGVSDAAVVDAAKGDAAAQPCAIAVDGGTVACTTQVVSANDYDLFCGLKADGRINCWASEGDSFMFGPFGRWPATLAKAPPNLVQLAVSNVLTPDADSYYVCGVDQGGAGSCWSDVGSKNMGAGLKAIIVSDYGICTLDSQGAAACDHRVSGAPPSSGVYARILASEINVAALDVAGVPYYPLRTFPDGRYIDIASNDAGHVAAVRSDGTAVTMDQAGNPVLRPGSFTHIAVDYYGRSCALDGAGEVTCWAGDSGVTLAALTPPAGPFVQIVGATTAFCAIRTTGTTACFGDVPIDVPPGW